MIKKYKLYYNQQTLSGSRRIVFYILKTYQEVFLHLKEVQDF